jgi:hypothetical protein
MLLRSMILLGAAVRRAVAVDVGMTTTAIRL